MPRARHPSWLPTVLACAALLVVPLLALLLLPAPTRRPPAREAPIAPPTQPAATGVVEPATERAGVVSGSVRGDDGLPIDGARVRIGAVEATTSASGEFHIESVPDRAATVIAVKAGFAEGRAQLLAASPPGSERRIDLTLTRAGAVAGVVYGPDGKPIAKAFVSCDDRPGIGAGTDGEGRFELPPDADGCAATAVHDAYATSDVVRLRAGSDNRLDLGRSGGIAGVVLDERGMPVRAYLVAIESFVPAGAPDTPSPTGKARKIDDLGGAFAFEALPAGRYVLTASAEGRPPAKSDAVKVESGATTSHVRITLPVGASLVGTVSDAETRARIAGATVALDGQTETGANAIASVTSDDGGAFTLVGVPPGPFSVRIAREGYRTKIVPGLVTRGAPTLEGRFELTPAGDGGAGMELAGIGAVLAGTPKGVVVASVVEGGPAAKAGVAKGDRIDRIDGGDASALAVADCVQRLRGPAGTRVAVTLFREPSQSLDLIITREVVVR